MTAVSNAGTAALYLMATVSVPVLEPLDYQGRSYVRGEMLSTSAVEAAVLARRGKVTLTRGTVISREMTAVQEVPDPARVKRRYRRRDMTAEGSVE